jgi:dihydrodipicolinate synthase/N-acetylneuraminate lyase
MSMSERKRLVEIVIEEANGKVPVVPGCNHTGTNLVIDLAKHAEKAGADGVMVIPPYYWEPTDELVIRHYQAISDAAEIPLMVYNNELVVRKDLSIDVLDKLADIPNVAWVKDCTLSFAKLRQTVERIGDRVGIINGLGALLEPYSYDIGCCGFISDEANFAPEIMVELHKACKCRDIAKAKEIYGKIRSLTQFIGSRYWSSRIYAVKEAMRLRGLPAGEASRLPVYPYSDQEAKQLSQILVDLGLIRTP